MKHLFLHGFGGSLHDWDSVIEEMPEKESCEALTLPGHLSASARSENNPPLTSPKRGMNLSFENNVDAFFKPYFVNQNEPIVLIGYSMGARLALSFALRNPEKIKALILCSTSAGMDEGASLSQRIEWEKRIIDDMAQLGHEGFFKKWYELPLFHTLENKPEIMDTILSRKSTLDMKSLALAFQTFALSRQPRYWQQLKNFTIPTLLLHGEFDSKYENIMNKMNAILPNADVKAIPNASHAVHIENPRFLSDKVTSFIHTF